MTYKTQFLLASMMLIEVLCIPVKITGQALDHRLGEIIIQLDTSEPTPSLTTAIPAIATARTSAPEITPLLPEMNIWKLSLDYTQINEREVLYHLRKMDAVIHAQFNYLIEWRASPNDPDYGLQWHWNNTGQIGLPKGVDLRLEEAWEYTTGGVTPDGDTIVACVIDGSFERKHEDLAPNLWTNRAEIPDNGLDDDHNGYIDDYYGWNVKDNNDNIGGSGTHGTGVAGLLGARGNNGIGVTGINWKVKMMFISGISDIASVLRAYAYPLRMRRLYNATHGAKGAFVVVTNASWGISALHASDAPLWCAFYDSLGQAGILNCCAAPNRGVDIDQIGDLPSDCTSPFLLSITNITHKDEWYTKAGYGAKSVDLGCFGQDTYTTGPNNSYRNFGGTSAATPIVSGAIALLYSKAQCNALSAMAKTHPEEAALTVRHLLFEYAHPIPSLAGRCTSGGRLDILNAMKHTIPYYSFEHKDTSVMLSWTGMQDTLSSLEYRTEGSTQWQSILHASRPLRLTGLTGCATYEVRTTDFCQPDTTPVYYVFQTEGCCHLPDPVRITATDSFSVQLSWPPVYAARAYQILLTGPLPEDTTTQVVEVLPDSNAHYFITGLSPCSNYAIQVRTTCADSMSETGDTLFFRTKGCGACLDLSYCSPVIPPDAADDRMTSLTVGDSMMVIPGGFSGYEIVPHSPFEWTFCDSIPLEIHTAGTTRELLLVWVDYDQSGGFDTSEIIFQTPSPQAAPYKRMIQLPPEAKRGITRMRLALKWPGFDPTPPHPCGDDIEFGQVIDLCINIVDNCMALPLMPKVDTSLIDTTIFRWKACAPSRKYKLTYLLPDSQEVSYLTKTPLLKLTDLPKCVTLTAYLSQTCDTSANPIPENWSKPRTFMFRTRCKTATERPVGNPSFRLYPNPSSGVFLLQYISAVKRGQWTLTDLTGQKVRTGEIPDSSRMTYIDLRPVDTGVYVFELKTKDGSFVRPIVIL